MRNVMNEDRMDWKNESKWSIEGIEEVYRYKSHFKLIHVMILGRVMLDSWGSGTHTCYSLHINHQAWTFIQLRIDFAPFLKGSQKVLPKMWEKIFYRQWRVMPSIG